MGAPGWTVLRSLVRSASFPDLEPPVRLSLSRRLPAGQRVSEGLGTWVWVLITAIALTIVCLALLYGGAVLTWSGSHS